MSKLSETQVDKIEMIIFDCITKARKLHKGAYEQEHLCTDTLARVKHIVENHSDPTVIK